MEAGWLDHNFFRKAETTVTHEVATSPDATVDVRVEIQDDEAMLFQWTYRHDTKAAMWALAAEEFRRRHVTLQELLDPVITEACDCAPRAFQQNGIKCERAASGSTELPSLHTEFAAAG